MTSFLTARRLATILFADVSGYSRIMRADEERGLMLRCPVSLRD
jgi:class 3 adenylate cyclase